MVDSFGYPYAYIVNFLWVSLWRLSLRGLVLGFCVSLWITLGFVLSFEFHRSFVLLDGSLSEGDWYIVCSLYVSSFVVDPLPLLAHGMDRVRESLDRLDQNHVNPCFFVLCFDCSWSFVYSLLRDSWDSSLRGDFRTATWRVCIGRRLKNVQKKKQTFRKVT